MLMLSSKVECCDIAGAVNVLEVYMPALMIFFLGFNRRVASTSDTTTRHLFL